MVEKRVNKQKRRSLLCKSQNKRGQDLQTVGVCMCTDSREADLWTQYLLHLKPAH